MDRCKSCQNILPRTVDRCPVCGHDTMPVVAPQERGPEAPAPRDFRASMEGNELPSPVDDPNLLPAAQNLEVEAHDLERSKRIQRSNDFELPALSEQMRSVAALSSRLDSNIRIGKRPTHAPRIAAAAILAIASFAIGTAVGASRNGDNSVIAMTVAEVPVGAGTVELVVEGIVEDFDPRAIVDISEPDSCSKPVAAKGYVLDGGVVAVSSFDVDRASSPRISVGDVESTGDVLGNSSLNNITIIGSETPLVNKLQIITANVSSGQKVALVDFRGDQIILTPATVTSLRQRSGELLGFSVGSEINEAGEIETSKPPRNTLVLDDRGDVVGLIDQDGTAISGARIAETVAQFRLDPTFPGPRC